MLIHILIYIYSFIYVLKHMHTYLHISGGMVIRAYNYHVRIIDSSFRFNTALENVTNLVGGDGGTICI